MPARPVSERDDDLVAEWRPDDLRRLKVRFLFGFVLAFVALAIIEGARGDSYWAFAFAVIALAEMGLAGCFSMWTNRSHVELTSTEVVSRRGRREDRVRLEDIRGVVVGGTYRKGWATWLILDGGRSVRLVAPAFVFYNRLKVYGATGTTYWRQIAESPTGRQAVLVHAAAGIGDTIAPTIRSHPLRGDLARWWSPTGENSSVTAFL